MSDDQTSQAAAAGILAVAGIILVFAVLIGLGILAFICYLVFNCYKRIPKEHRKMEPGMVWLLMIPCFNLVWNFFVYPKLSKSFKSYFDSVGDTSVGDCSEGLATAYAIVAACAIVPYLNLLAGPASLITLIIYLIKAHELKNKIPIGAENIPQPPSPPVPPIIS